MEEDYTARKQAYRLIERARARSPEILKLAAEAAERQRRMTDDDRKRAIEQIVKNTAFAGD